MPQATPPVPGGWLDDFAPFTLLHLISVVVCIMLIAGSCWRGRCWCYGSPRERRFRLAWGCFAIALMVARNAIYLHPARFDIQTSLPLHLCDLGMLAAALAMIWPRRLWRTLLYFWGIGLSTQAFATPTLQFGVAWLQFWFFWLSHLVIVGSAVYDLIVGRYRPTGRDVATAVLVTLLYAAAMIAVNLALGVNYGFLGQSKPSNPTVIDQLGPWPGRVFIIAGAVALEYLLLWLVWPMARRLARPAAPPPARTT